jgi:hypothetical protein
MTDHNLPRLTAMMDLQLLGNGPTTHMAADNVQQCQRSTPAVCSGSSGPQAFVEQYAMLM